MGLLGDTTHFLQDVLKVELVKPEQAASGMADKVVRADSFACVVVLPQLQGKLPILW